MIVSGVDESRLQNQILHHLIFNTEVSLLVARIVQVLVNRGKVSKVCLSGQEFSRCRRLLDRLLRRRSTSHQCGISIAASELLDRQRRKERSRKAQIGNRVQEDIVISNTI